MGYKKNHPLSWTSQFRSIVIVLVVLPVAYLVFFTDKGTYAETRPTSV